MRRRKVDPRVDQFRQVLLAARRAPGTVDVYGRIAARIAASGKLAADWLLEIDPTASASTKQGLASAATAWWQFLQTLEPGVDHGPPPVRPEDTGVSRMEEIREGLSKQQWLEFDRAVRKWMKGSHRTILLLLPRSALRISEILFLQMKQLTRQAVTLEDGSTASVFALRFAGKGRGGMAAGGGKERWVPLGVKATAILERWLVSRPDNPGNNTWVFPGVRGHPMTPDAVRKQISRQLRDHLPAEWRDQVVPHVLRHTYAFQFLDENGYQSLAALQQILGHRDLKTTMRYAKGSKGQLAALAGRVGPERG